MKKRKADMILISVLSVSALIGLVLFSLFGKEGKTVVVTDNGEVKATYSLSDTAEEVIRSENGGENLLIIENGEARIESADCPDKICCEHRPVSKSGESIICLPNKIVVSVEN